jgi:hypothetical protein
MALDTLMAALEKLDGSITVLEKAVTKIEQRPKTSARGRGNNQLDMFGMPTAPLQAASNIDVADVSHRLSRVIAQIETVLGDAA